jgi:hypothetical protein
MTWPFQKFRLARRLGLCSRFGEGSSFSVKAGNKKSASRRTEILGNAKCRKISAALYFHYFHHTHYKV